MYSVLRVCPHHLLMHSELKSLNNKDKICNYISENSKINTKDFKNKIEGLGVKGVFMIIGLMISQIFLTGIL